MTEHAKGYDPSKEKLALINENKEVEEVVLKHLDSLASNSLDGRWYSIARTHIEQGFMALNRAVGQPKRLT